MDSIVGDILMLCVGGTLGARVTRTSQSHSGPPYLYKPHSHTSSLAPVFTPWSAINQSDSIMHYLPNEIQK